MERHELAQGLFGIPGRVEWFDWRQTCPGPFFGDILRVGALNFGGVLQHDGGKVPRGERAIDVSGVALAAEVWQIPAVVDMRVAENDGVELFRVEREVAGPPGGFGPVCPETNTTRQQ